MSHPLCLKHEQRGVSLTDHSTWCYGCEIDGLRSDLAQAREEADQFRHLGGVMAQQGALCDKLVQQLDAQVQSLTAQVIDRDQALSVAQKNQEAAESEAQRLREALAEIRSKMPDSPDQLRHWLTPELVNSEIGHKLLVEIPEAVDRALHPAEGA